MTTRSSNGGESSNISGARNSPGLSLNGSSKSTGSGPNVLFTVFTISMIVGIMWVAYGSGRTTSETRDRLSASIADLRKTRDQLLANLADRDAKIANLTAALATQPKERVVVQYEECPAIPGFRENSRWGTSRVPSQKRDLPWVGK